MYKKYINYFGPYGNTRTGSDSSDQNTWIHNLTFDGLFITIIFYDRGGVDSIHSLFTCKTIVKVNFFGEKNCMVKYSKIFNV